MLNETFCVIFKHRVYTLENGFFTIKTVWPARLLGIVEYFTSLRP